jgi:hypothetical protein
MQGRKPSLTENLEKGIGEYIPFNVAAPEKVAAQAMGGAMHGLLMGKEGQTNAMGFLPSGKLGAAIEDSLLNILAPKAVQSIGAGLKFAGQSVKKGYEYLTAGSMAKSLEKELGENVSKLESNAKNQINYVNQEAEKEVGQLNKNIENESQGIVQGLGKGARTTQEVETQIANESRRIHDANEANAGIYFDTVLNEVDRTPNGGLLYKKNDPLISMGFDEGRALMSQIEDLNVGELYDVFKSNPTFRNAHNLKQQLGLLLGELKRVPRKTAAERLELGKLSDAYNRLGQDMKSYLTDKFPNKNMDLSGMWQRGTDIWRETVEPFLSNKKLREINRGRKKYVSNIHEAFKNPDAGDIIDRTGEVIKGSGSKLLDMLPQDVKDMIVYSKAGVPTSHEPTKLVDAIQKAERTGYQQYVSPQLKDSIATILDQQGMVSNIEKAVKSHTKELETGLRGQIEQIKDLYKPKIKEHKSRHETMRRVGRRVAYTSGLGAPGAYLLEESIRRKL